jgi:hypothetical protein
VSDDNGSRLAPWQAGFRFLLEMVAIVFWGIVGWQITDGAARWILVIVLPLAAAVVWGTFRAPDDHSANGESPVAVPGLVRVLIELGLLLGVAILTALVWRPTAGIVLGATVVFHYAATLRRVRWLLEQR